MLINLVFIEHNYGDPYMVTQNQALTTLWRRSVHAVFGIGGTSRVAVTRMSVNL